MQYLAIYLYVTAVGFVAAGVLASFVQLALGRADALHHRAEVDSGIRWPACCCALVAGPAILMRNAWRGQKLRERPKIWFGVSAVIAAVWSLFCGALLLDLLGTLG